ncbi:muconolactone Delta-isomerase family protein [Rudanella lutea]|uniref:muconolactone Delta-isomerase family protein n=1 Tax=Rudanella lutea TaxID=451374 RepID=UPI0003A84B0D|nr:muconolactone Delta-isomerase family protein [Rudanella lutea]
MSQYMVEFALPAEMNEEFVQKIPAQRLKVNELMESGKMLSYSLSADRQKLWCILKVDSELEVMEVIAQFPLIQYMDPTISELMFHNMVAARIPLFSLN